MQPITWEIIRFDIVDIQFQIVVKAVERLLIPRQGKKARPVQAFD
jgi:hypothetical protein